MKQIDYTLHRQCIQQIAASIPAQAHHCTTFTVQEGWLGLCLFYCYLARFTGDEAHFDQAGIYFDKALPLIGPQHYTKRFATDSYDSQLAGFGKFIAFAVHHDFLDTDALSYLPTTDEVLIRLMQTKISAGDFDLWSGALATGHYLLQRPNADAQHRQALADIVLGLEKNAQSDPASGGLYWPAPSLKNRVYLGISHGSAMIMSFLAAVYEQGIEPDRCGELIRKATRFVQSKQRDYPNSLFPDQRNDQPAPTQFSQCYGDLGVGYGLFRANQVLNDPTLGHLTDAVLRNCTERTVELGLTADASITYGASGVAAVFDKLWRLSDNSLYEASANYWYAHIPDYADQANAFAGFDCMIAGVSDATRLSFGWGVIGEGISLMKFLRKELPPLDGFTFLV